MMLYRFSDYQKVMPVELRNFFREECIKLQVSVRDEEALIFRMAELAADMHDLVQKDVHALLRGLLSEGLSGIGHGVAIPHVRVPGLKALAGVLLVLEKPINADAVDRIPVDIVFLMLVPEADESDHLRALAKTSRLLRDEALCDKLRGCKNAEAAFVLLTQAQSEKAA